MRSLRLVNLLMVIGALAAALPLVVSASPADLPSTQTNLLKNASLESFSSDGKAVDWVQWSAPGEGCGRLTPQFRQATTSQDTRRIKDGTSAQQFLASSTDPGGSFFGGLWQIVTGVTPGKTYRFTIWGHAWSSTGDNPSLSENTGAINFRVGIGQGAITADNPSIKWSDFYNFKDTFGQMQVEAAAGSNTITVFTVANPASCAKHTEVFWDAASLVDTGGASTQPTSPPAQPPTATLRVVPTRFPTPTPNAEGKIIYIVQAGNTIIDICGVIGRGNDPSCIDDIINWNGLSNPRGIFVGQQLIIGQGPGSAQPTAAPTETPAAAGTDAAGTTAPGVTDPAGTPGTGGEPTAPPEAASATPAGAAAICVTLYNDANGNGVFDPSEGKVAGGSFALLDVGNSNPVANYTTDGASEPYCFENLPGGSYRITSAVPEGYKATTRSDWDLTLIAASTANLEFGAQSTGEVSGPGNGGGGGSGGSALLIRTLLAAAGVVLLLIAAGVAGFLVLTRRR